MTTATRRRDGIMRITVRVEAHLSLSEAAFAVAQWSYLDADEISTASKRDLLRWIRDGLLDGGRDHLAMGDITDCEPEYDAAVLRLVEVGVFPQSAADDEFAGRYLGGDA